MTLAVHTAFTLLNHSIIMKRTKSQSRLATITLALFLPIFVASTWFGRGFYDRKFMLEGQIVVVNATTEDRKVRLVFPNGEEIEVDVRAGVSSRSAVSETGEGSIGVTVDGSSRDEVGYVTSMNGMIIFTVSENRVTLSQVSL